MELKLLTVKVLQSHQLSHKFNSNLKPGVSLLLKDIMKISGLLMILNACYFQTLFRSSQWQIL